MVWVVAGAVEAQVGLLVLVGQQGLAATDLGDSGFFFEGSIVVACVVGLGPGPFAFSIRRDGRDGRDGRTRPDDFEFGGSLC